MVTPYVTDVDFTLYVGDVVDVLQELNPEYARLAATRLSQLSLLAEGAA